MEKTIAEFKKNKNYLICIDSDGCAMDTMDIKHFNCFGPCMVDEWELDKWKDEILTRWNEINLYTMTRGINRFKGLAMALLEINETYKKIEGCVTFNQWAENAKELSNSAVEAMYQETGDEIFKKALSWSKSVNISIQNLPKEEKKVFAGAKEGLKAASKLADVAIVSSANVDAVEEEWNTHGLLEYVDVLLCQDAGSKAFCIQELLKKGYEKEHVLMVGDAPGDLDAAKKNGVFFYPILVKKEKESWEEAPSAFEKLVEDCYQNYGEQKKQEFIQNLTK